MVFGILIRKGTDVAYLYEFEAKLREKYTALSYQKKLLDHY